MNIENLVLSDLKALANYISLDQVPSSWFNCFEKIKESYRKDWLNNYDFNNILLYYSLDNHFIDRFYEEMELLSKDKTLNFICYIMYYVLFKSSEKDFYNIWSWKSTNETFKNNGSFMIPVVSLLCGHEIHIENMKKRGFDNEQIELQKYNIRLTCTNDRIKYNIDGIRFSQMIWGSFFMKGFLVQLGRLQYEIGVKNFEKLDKYFQEKHDYIYIHIPRANNLKPEEVDASLSTIGEYIKTYFPEYRDKKLAFYTNSWLLSPEIKEILPSSSNIIKFQERFNIIEYEEYNNDFLNFVFDDVLGNVEYKDLSEDTTLQKELKKMLLKGKKLHLGCGFLKDNY